MDGQRTQQQRAGRAEVGHLIIADAAGAYYNKFVIQQVQLSYTYIVGIQSERWVTAESGTDDTSVMSDGATCSNAANGHI